MDAIQADLLLLNVAQVVTCASSDGPKRGTDLQDVGLIEEGAVAVRDGHIVAVGKTAELTSTVNARQSLDLSGHALCPGFVDPHTHAVFGGDRVHEFEMRIRGASYMEIMAAGGGIVSTMRHTREASEAELVAATRKRLDEMLALGTTAVEIKSGYGLDTVTELKMLRVIEQLDLSHPCTLVPTFLGAHTLPPEYKNDPDGYVDLVIDEMIPAVAGWYTQSHFPQQNRPLFIDVFCEDHAFDVDQSRRILQSGQAAGMGAKIHVDQFNALGGTQMAVEIGAVTADHLDVTSDDGLQALANSDTISVPLPAANFNLGHTHFANGRGLIDAGGALALATDLNPGSAPCYSMPLVMTIACRYLRLLPAEALLASTINAAYALGMAQHIGSIEVGKQADLLLLKEADYRHVAYFFGGNPVAKVMVKGQWVS
jgi:imidazolonepropionase